MVSVEKLGREAPSSVTPSVVDAISTPPVGVKSVTFPLPGGRSAVTITSLYGRCDPLDHRGLDTGAPLVRYGAAIRLKKPSPKC
ncbi:hypothetical protein QC762_0021030 [Podospora pseudocomata]|uniref:Uncharacterized protein n=2 Tax=Podospora TaxID=5144 RepID=A0ABR0GYC5_9PEZI|nr:hypothetical protein QC762_0021030 [Podospora pseudocomata]KAK4682956.1 hypothetical protein QC764_0024490 [Podospora pseudoanserina]